MGLQDFTISSNNIVGTIPSELFKCTKMTQLFLYNNHITGTIPTNFHQLKDLSLRKYVCPKLLFFC